MAALPRYEMEYHITSIVKGDDDATFTVRRNGKVFYIEISPSNFVNSPAMAKKYRSYLEVLKSGEEVLDQVYDTDVYEWVMAPFEHFLIELAPDPSVESVENIAVTLKEYLYPEFFAFILDIIDENLQPRHVPTESHQKKVMIDKGQTACFFKRCHGSVQITQELKTYKKIHAVGLDSQVNQCHVYGIVMDDNDFIPGLLLTHIDCGRPLSTIVHPEEPNDLPPALRERRMAQIEAALSALHANDMVWGDVKAANILIDENDNAWLIDFGGGYTEGWDRDGGFCRDG
ncbi:hypothetical protein M441DRAFT_82761 [Trichoderma asperellum CBS 433.97]|uniref:Protein kinase domain-containing protein n=1 Tax=Trichoderma asperellum (strain ATCC 204424 / CBS 433.97 / NBRC 101777) TaxID=1042311 RepID=A0A2T3YYM6_TRIA4|nr:hypothetical protein M441DRAFT_82761 [Trichoderma asperellum CBS 433.97]PTB37665.1 hypothetical protein M441DRAFT_82761 [Trichoderma asperellum CBS 433.97]